MLGRCNDEQFRDPQHDRVSSHRPHRAAYPYGSSKNETMLTLRYCFPSEPVPQFPNPPHMASEPHSHEEHRR